MAEINSISVNPRDLSGKGSSRAIRREGLIPGIIYGDDQEPILISMDPRQLIAEMSKPGFSSKIFEIQVKDKKYRAMAQDIQMHDVNDRPIHVDFRKITKSTIVTVSIEVKFINDEESPGLKKGGVLNTVRHEIEVKGKPDILPPFFEVNLAGTEIGDSVHISAVDIPDGISPTITDRDFTICTIAPPTIVQTEEEVEEEAGEEEAEQKETSDDGKEENKD